MAPPFHHVFGNLSKRKRSAFAAFVFLCAAPADAQDSSGDSGSLVCNEFKLSATRALAQSPDSLQVNNLLFDAARKGCVDALGTLAKAGASPAARDRMGNNALAIAAKAGRLPFVKALLEGDKAIVADELDRANVEGSTPLIQAALADRVAIARLLVEAGAKADAINEHGETALSAAAFNADAPLAEYLLERGAAPDTVDTTGKGVIVYAAARGATRIVEMLLKAGVDPNRRYKADLTALMWAAGHADNVAKDDGVRTVKLLIDHGATIDLADDRGRTALMIAAGLDHGAVVQALIAAGADRAKRDKSGKTAADLAGGDDARAVLADP